MVKRSGLNPAGKKCLVLGSGGASATAVVALEEMGGQVVVISRSGENNYANLHLHADAAILCNCTPVGMYPNNGISPVALDLFPMLEGVLDVIYNPARTKLLLDAEKRGLVAMNGLWMLVAQAKEASEWFTGTPLPDDCLEAVYQKLRLEMENIILIGMPGCGKSTIGKALAEHLGKEFVDADSVLEKAEGRLICQIIPEDGEDYFRKLESQTLELLGKQSGLVIATGGGCVTREENFPYLRQNGRIFWLQRDLKLLPTDGRPLSQMNKLEDLYWKREPLYRKWADHIIDNNGPESQTIDRILAILEENS
jgi:shikimate dehydrogenase